MTKTGIPGIIIFWHFKLHIYKSSSPPPQDYKRLESESESELFTGDTSKDNHSPGPVFREVSP